MRHLMFIALLWCNAAFSGCIGDGNAAANSGKYDEAIAHYSRCIKSSPQKTYWGLGYVYDEKGQYGLAIQNYTKAIQLKPSSILYSYR